MYANYLLDEYKKAQNYTQDKQIAADLNLNKTRISEIRKGKRYVSDFEAVFLAERANIDPKEALVGCHADRQENAKLKSLWEDITKKIKGQNYQVYSAVLAALTYSLEPSIQSNVKCALCTLC
ncbi:DUF3693 domain-containing protein [Photobacterium leiognathi]|uniref:DUF3693 domain-containing protein n=1 Tax=Photobacterium leiognathi TaxID=553611 RepID=UPI002981B811|nr:DUF3693 domain-containing protein [Photobacterium leiognathi]